MNLHKSILILFSLFLCYISDAQDITDTILPISEVRISADRIFNKDFAGMKFTEIDTLILQQKQNISLSALLSENTSIFIKNNGRGALSTAAFRGTAASHTQVSWNGININSPMEGMVDFSLIPVFIIDDMNLKHGTASISDNNGGLGGSININNSANWNNKNTVKYSQSFGSYHTYGEFLQLNFKKNNIKSKTRIYHNYSKNDFTFINHGIAIIDSITGEISNPLDTNDNADFSSCGILQEIYFKPNNKNIFSLKYWGQKSDRTIPRATSYEGPDNTNRNKQNNFDNKAVLDWKYYSKSNIFILRSGFSIKSMTYTLKNNIVGVGLTPAIFSQSTQKSSYNSFSLTHNFSKNLSIKTSLYADFHDVATFDTVNKIGYTEKRTDLSGFISIRKEIANRLNINAMMRQNLSKNEITPFVPYLGFDFKIFKDKNLILKGNIARNFHQPTLNDLYWQPGGNPELKPESGKSFELGFAYLFSQKSTSFSAEITAYHSDINNWILWIPSYKGYWEARNIENVVSKGIELNLKLIGKINKIRYSISGTYAYTSSVNYGDKNIWGENSYGKQLVYVPLHSGNIMANCSYKDFYITFQNNSYSERYTTSSNDITRRDWLYPYFMNDLTFGKIFKIKKLSISTDLKINNIFNETYHSILYRPMPKRNFLLMIMFKF